MNERQLLVNREWNLNQDKVNWYTSLNKLRDYPSVKFSDFYDTTSSAGDWNGYMVQRIKNVNYMIFFSQSNNYPRAGFTVYTFDIAARWIGDLYRKDVENILNDILAEYL